MNYLKRWVGSLFMKNKYFCFTLLLLNSCGESGKSVCESYGAGFKIVNTIDKTRIYKPDSDTSDNLHFRPVEIDVWYPAEQIIADSVLSFRNILSLLEKRAIYYTGSEQWRGITPTIAQSFCVGFKCSDSTSLLNFTTDSYRNAKAAKSKFPLVIYLCAYNGMSYENFSLFEKLTAAGYVVVSISSIGRYPGDMTMKNEDMLEQVNDAEASIRLVANESNIDFSHIGVIGYSWGGLTAALLSGRLSNICCLVSFDGSEYHHYGNLVEENADFEDIRKSREFRNLQIRVPYLRLESTASDEIIKIDSIFDFSKKLTGNFVILGIDSARHEDFTCLSKVVMESGNCTNNGRFDIISELTISFLNDKLKNKKTFYQTVDKENRNIRQVKF
jgi:dienelactone hydrolase